MKTQLRFKEGQDYPEQQNGLPKAFFHNPKYRDMSVNARYLYMIFTLRMTESQNKGWIDDDGNIYIIYSDEDLMKEMHCKSCTVDKLKNELVEFDLLSMERHSNHLYPLHVSNSYSH